MCKECGNRKKDKYLTHKKTNHCAHGIALVVETQKFHLKEFLR